MGQTMSWSNFSVSPDPLNGAMDIARHTVRGKRQKGSKIGAAIEQAALALGTTPRRTRALLYGEVFAVARAEYYRLLDRFLAHLDAEAVELEKEAEAVREHRRQLSLLGDLECSGGKPSVSGGSNARSEDSFADVDAAERRYRTLRAEIARDRVGKR